MRFWRRSPETEKCIKGDEPDIRKAAALLLDDFRSGRIGRITLESPTEQA